MNFIFIYSGKGIINVYVIAVDGGCIAQHKPLYNLFAAWIHNIPSFASILLNILWPGTHICRISVLCLVSNQVYCYHDVYDLRYLPGMTRGHLHHPLEAPGRIWTPDLLITSQPLCRAELPGHSYTSVKLAYKLYGSCSRITSGAEVAFDVI